jgi:hypothetical protein
VAAEDQAAAEVTPGEAISASPRQEPDPSLGALKLVFLGWSPRLVTLDQPERLKETIHALLDVEKHLCIEFLDAIEVWYPTAEHFSELEVRMRYAEKEAVIESLENSYAEDRGDVLSFDSQPPPMPDRGDLLSFDSQPPPMPESYVDVIQVLRGDAERVNPYPGSDEARRKAAWNDFGRFTNRDFVDPLIVQALSCTDPLRANLLVAAASLCKSIRQDAVLLELEATRTAEHAVVAGQLPRQRQAEKAFLAKLTRLLAVVRELSKP